MSTHLSTNNDIKILLNIQDENISFEDNCVTEGTYKGNKCHFIEGINNKIKVLNRVAYGYRNFSHYKKRIMIHFKFKAQETKSEQKKTHVKAS